MERREFKIFLKNLTFFFVEYVVQRAQTENGRQAPNVCKQSQKQKQKFTQPLRPQRSSIGLPQMLSNPIFRAKSHLTFTKSR